MFRDKIIIGLNFAVFLMMVGVGMIVARLPQKLIDISGSGTSVGYLASAFAISYIAVQVPVGNISDRVGFKVLLIGGYLLCALAGLIFYLSESEHLIFLGRLVQGAGEAPVWALVPALLSVRYPRAKGQVMGIYNATMHLGLTAGPLLGILFVRIWPGEQVFFFYACTCLAGSLIIFFTVENTRSGKPLRENTLSLKQLVALTARREVLVLLMGIALYGAGYGIFITAIPAFLICAKGFSPASTGLFFALFYVAVSVSQIITGPVSDRIGRSGFMITGLVVAGIGIAAFPGLGQIECLAVLTLAGLGLGVFYLASLASLNETVPASLRGTISGAYYCFWGLGMFFGPMLIGGSGETPDNTGFYLFAAALMAEAIGLRILRKG